MSLIRSWIFILFLGLVSFYSGYTGIEVQAEPKAYDMILPESDTRFYSESELLDMSPQVLCYARNEIYARYGRKFQSKELTEYFELQPWYYGRTDAADFSEDIFNEYEVKNIETLRSLEKRPGVKEYQLDQAGYSFDEIDRYISCKRVYVKTEYIGIAEGLTYDPEFRILHTDYVEFCIPDEWEENFGIANNSESSLELYCSPLRQPEDYGGTLAVICRFEEYTPEDYFPHAYYIGENNGYYFYFMRPTDVQFDPEDQEGAALYMEMDEVADEILDTFYIVP